MLLGLALCVWMLAFASHIHGGDELPSNGPSTACSFCLSLPAGAPPPTQAVVSELVLVTTDQVAEPDTSWVAYDVPSFYLSQGPPAA